MTNHYPVREGPCPIVGRCLRRLRDMAARLIFEDEHENIDALEERYQSVSGHPDYVRLRGFLVVEKMLGFIYRVYSKKCVAFTDPFELPARSWGGLGDRKRMLETLLDQTDIEIGELQLGGTKFKDNHLLQMGSNLYGATQQESVAAASRAERAIQLQGLLKIAIHSIDVLRPYLRNENVSVGILGDDLASMAKEIYGLTVTKPFLELTRELMDVRL
jgi:hypothetical protein